MLVIKITIPEVASYFEEYLISEDLGYTRHGGEFEIPSADTVGWLLGRRYEYLLSKYKSKQQNKDVIQIQEKENIGEDSAGHKLG